MGHMMSIRSQYFSLKHIIYMFSCLSFVFRRPQMTVTTSVSGASSWIGDPPVGCPPCPRVTGQLTGSTLSFSESVGVMGRLDATSATVCFIYSYF